MAINIHPKPGQILFCDFSQGFVKPEMVKSGRPVVVLTGPIKGRDKLVKHCGAQPPAALPL
jgi:mRNA interferase MazF